ncbi:Hypothetical predicted protein [Marmota monax]|uniref:Uncharacterized protein n=1 Tax=Marmota monax TaxID=9995 RepID=A0A5E4BS60_MARMO|nr:Hypothetical predicted protein [Marmota monax]
MWKGCTSSLRLAPDLRGIVRPPASSLKGKEPRRRQQRRPGARAFAAPPSLPRRTPPGSERRAQES